MEIKVFEIGGSCGYKVWISEDSHKVLEIIYDDIRQGGTIEKSKDGITECDYSFLKDAEKEVYDKIIRVKNGEAHHKYRVINKNGEFGPFESWELEYPHNKKTFITPDARIEISKYKRRSVLSF